MSFAVCCSGSTLEVGVVYATGLMLSTLELVSEVALLLVICCTGTVMLPVLSPPLVRTSGTLLVDCSGTAVVKLALTTGTLLDCWPVTSVSFFNVNGIPLHRRVSVASRQTKGETMTHVGLGL